MTRVLLTGGSGFIAAHVLEALLEHGHSVVTTVRSHDKGKRILETHSKKYGKDKLDYVIVEDISQANAFEKAVVSDPPFEAVIHTASPFHFEATTEEKIRDLIKTAVNGTTGVLQAIKASAPTVKRVVVTSSFAAIVDGKKPPNTTYSEADWDPITLEEALESPAVGYRASKTYAEKAAWEFVEKEKPNFQLSTCNPPLVLGPIVNYLNSLDSINTSNQRFRDFITGAAKEKCPPTSVFLWIDVRDLALAHVIAMEKDAAVGERLFIVRGHFSNKEIVEAIGKNFPEYKDILPSGDALKSGDYPEAGYPSADDKKTREILQIKYRDLEGCVTDTVKSLQPLLKGSA